MVFAADGDSAVVMAFKNWEVYEIGRLGKVRWDIVLSFACHSGRCRGRSSRMVRL